LVVWRDVANHCACAKEVGAADDPKGSPYHGWLGADDGAST